MILLWSIRRRLLHQRKQLSLKGARDQELMASMFVASLDIASRLALLGLPRALLLGELCLLLWERFSAL